MKQFNLEADNGSPKTSQFTLPAYEHFSILVRYRNWDDKQEWLGYTLADQSEKDVVKYRMEQPDDGVLYFCGGISASQKLHFASVSGESSYTPRDVIQMVALPSSTQDNCYVCSADYARTAGEGGGGGVSQEYVDTKVQDEATAREAADEATKAELDSLAAVVGNANTKLEEIA